MANKDNELKKLEIIDYHFIDMESGEDTLAKIWNHQKNMQEKTYGYNFEDMTIGQIVDFSFMNKHAIEDELGEYMDALGGIKDGVGNAAWKPWKAANKDIRSKTLKDLSPGDLLELKYEAVDLIHFILNACIVIGMKPEELYNMYYAKAQENILRQQNSY